MYTHTVVDNNKSFEDEHEEKKWMDVFPDSKPWVNWQSELPYQ